MSKVSIVKCSNYDRENIYNSVKESVNLAGGFEFVKGKKVLLKPNLLAPSKPEQSVTTHPEVVRAVIKLAYENGAESVAVGDSPGIGTQDIIYNMTGIKKVVEEEKAVIANFREKVDLENHEGKLVKKFEVAKAVKDADIIISIAKLKTHGMTYFTGSMKNLFGTVPGVLKPQFHFKFPDKNDFAEMIVDLNLALKPHFGIIDGVMGMEGNGPRSGNARFIGVIMASKDLTALDATACRVVGINPDNINIIKNGAERGLGVIEEDDIKIEGTLIGEVVVKNFKQITREKDILSLLPFKLPKFINNIIKNILVPKPFFIHKKCILCNECVKVCPVEPKALKNENKKIEINRNLCIRCFCCQEMCPVGAIEPKRFCK
jgi:uncharacterized protein (DUF362 family)/NAD-dependent dihydropyrimidine dehydrogenase PreA subunit